MVSMGGKGGGGGTSTQSYYTPQFYQPYQQYETNALNTANNLANAPFQPYDISKMFAPFQPAQTQAFNQVSGLQNSYQPFFNNAQTQLNNYSGYNPISAASPYFAQAGATPTALQAASPYTTQAAQTFNQPGVAASYMSPYLSNAVDATSQMLTKNFLQNTLPGINSEFVASGGGLGGFNPAYNKAQDWATTNFNQNLNNTVANMTNQGYNTAANTFGADQARLAGLSGTVGNQATTTQAGLANLGTSLGNNIMGGVGTGINLGNAYAGLGTGQLNAGLLGSNALLQVGNQQQQNAQLPLTAAYQQYQQQQQWPYQTAQWGANLVNSFQWPNGYTQTSNSQQPGSTLGNVLGGLTSLASLAIPGAGGTSALGNIMGGFGSLFGGGAGSAIQPGSIGNSPAFGGMSYGYPRKRGGHVGHYARGGAVPGYGLGGTVGGLIGSIFGGSGPTIGNAIGDGLEMVLPFLLKRGGSIPGYDDGGPVRIYDEMIKRGIPLPGDRAKPPPYGAFMYPQHYTISDLPDNVIPILRPAKKAAGGYLGMDAPSKPVRSYPFGTFESRGFFSGGIDGPSEPVYTHLPNNAYDQGGSVGTSPQMPTFAPRNNAATPGFLQRMMQEAINARFDTQKFHYDPSGMNSGYAGGGDVGPNSVPADLFENYVESAGSDAGRERQIEEQRAANDADSAAAWFSHAFPNGYHFDSPNPLMPSTDHGDVRFARGGFFGMDEASYPPFFEWADHHYNTGGYVPTIRAARGHYSNEVRGFDERQAREAAAAKREQRPLAFRSGGAVDDASIMKTDVHKHEKLMHAGWPLTDINPTGHFSNTRAIAAVHKHESHDHKGEGKTRIKLPRKGSSKKRMAKAVWAHDHHMHPGKSRTPLGI